MAFGNLLSLIDPNIKTALAQDNLKTWDHASRLFIDNNHALAPKVDFLFHVFFDVNPNAYKYKDINELTEFGMLVKSVQLPKFTVEVNKYNAYNRPNVVQKKINYNDVTIEFYDDQSNIVNTFWYRYFNYYYRDRDGLLNEQEPQYKQPHKYDQKGMQWGYDIKDQKRERFLDSIRIYSLHKKQITEFTLYNPVITSFRHGEHRNNGNEPLRNEMVVEFETVNIRTGPATRAKGFGDLHYDKVPSPLTPVGGGTRSIFGQGGLGETGGEILGDLANGNFGSALFKGARAYQNNKGADFKQIARNEFSNILKGAVNGANPLSKFSVPSIGNLATTAIAGAGAGILKTAVNTFNGIPGNPTRTPQSVAQVAAQQPSNSGSPKIASNGERLVPPAQTRTSLPLTNSDEFKGIS